jgi:hypothetical protein
MSTSCGTATLEHAANEKMRQFEVVDRGAREASASSRE